MKKLILIGSLWVSQLAYAQEILIDKRMPANTQLNQFGKKSLKQKSLNNESLNYKSLSEQSQYIHSQNSVAVSLNTFHKEEIIDPNEVVKAQQNLEELQKSLYLQQVSLKKKREEYENAQSDFFHALNEKSTILVKKEQEISGLGLELTLGLDKIENTKKELEQAINKYRLKYQDLAQFEKALQDKEQHLSQLENNLASQDIILITKSEKVDSLVTEVSSKNSILEKQKDQLNEQANEIIKLKKDLARQQSLNNSQLVKKLSEIKKTETEVKPKTIQIESNTNTNNTASSIKKNYTGKNPVKITNYKDVKKTVTHKKSIEEVPLNNKEEFKEEKAQLNFKNQMTYSNKASKSLDLNNVLPPINAKGVLVENSINLFNPAKN